ncbi:MAG TPA: DUF3830 family protein [Vicinamibacterales bacterium]|nr:DUF3830 family protein [Vicinamibacterales bacterium]
MNPILITIGDRSIRGRLEVERAPHTCAAFRALLPLRGKVLQARWSGQAIWMPLHGLKTSVPEENLKHQPAPGEVLFYPEGASDCEILIPYGVTVFASRLGPLAGNHFLTLDIAADELKALGTRVWHEGEKPVVFEEVGPA